MTDMRDVFELVTKRTEPDLDSWRKQERYQRKRAQMRKTGAFVVVAALIIAGGVVYAVTNQGANITPAGQTTPPVATDQPTTTPGTSGDLESWYVGFIDLRTGEVSTIPIMTLSSFVDVSPDGTRIAYVDQDADGREVVHVADIDGSNIREFGDTAAPAGVAGPRWSPDGSSIVYQGQAKNGWVGNLYIVDVGSGQIRKITELEDHAADLYYMAPTFDPTGSTVLFDLEVEGADPQRLNLWSAPATGGEPTLVRRNAYLGDYSPDGSQIAFTSASPGDVGSGQLWVAPTAGGDAEKLATGSDFAMARWSPDGTRIAYNDGSGGIYVVNVETGEQTLVLESDRTPEWVDDDTLILTP